MNVRPAAIVLPEGRIANLAWDTRGTCQTCEDTGWVVVSLRSDKRVVAGKSVRGLPVEEMGPCPICARGFCLEFGFGRRRIQSGVMQEVQGRAPWGPNGFWARHAELLAGIKPPSWAVLIDGERHRQDRAEFSAE